MTERKKLSILSVGTVVKVGERQVEKLTFKANDGTSDMTFCTFHSSLFPLIKVGAALDCEIETKTREHDGTTYTDRNVNQIYVNGQAVAQKKGYFGNQNSASIEAQCVCKMINEAWIAGKLENEDPFVLRMKAFWDSKLPGQRAHDGGQRAAAGGRVVSGQTDGGQRAAGGEKTENDKSPATRHFQNLGQLLTAARDEKKLSRADVFLSLNVSQASEIADLDGAWKVLKPA
jgi:hypothetical protein